MGGTADTHARTLARLDPLETVHLVVDGETVTGVAASTYRGDECIRVDVAERGGKRTFRVQSHWVDGWLDPVVDVRASHDAGFVPGDRLDGVTLATDGGEPVDETAAEYETAAAEYDTPAAE